MNEECNLATGVQRFGHVTEDLQYGGGRKGNMRAYAVRDSDSGAEYSFMYADIVTDGYRTSRVGERVRFMVDPEDPTRARYVVRLDLPDVEEYYE